MKGMNSMTARMRPLSEERSASCTFAGNVTTFNSNEKGVWMLSDPSRVQIVAGRP